jgi:hypothetical protein
MRMAAAAGAAGAAALGAGSALARDMGDRDAEQPGEAPGAAGLAGWGFLPADEVFLLLVTVLADEFVERHGSNAQCGLKTALQQ